MTQSRTLRRLIKSGAARGDAEFVRAAEDLIREERSNKHHLLANDLERLLHGESSARRPVPARKYDVPMDRERGFALLEIHQPRHELGDLVLSDENRSALDEVILEQARSEVLGTHGLKPVSKLLFCGPPGCGKTTAAEVLGGELSLDVAVVRFDAVVSSFLGETAANLRRVFDFLASERVIALFDEFDAIGKTRADEAEHGELKRVVNAILQLIDSYRGPSILIAATNHERLLDRAVWRRFDEVLLLEPPTLPQLRELLRIKLRAVRHDLPVQDTAFLKGLSGFSHADVERIVVRAAKVMVLAGREILTSDLFEEARRRERRRLDLAGRS